MPLHNQTLIGGWGKADSIVVRIFRCISYAAAVCLVVIMLVAFFNVLGEKIFHKGIPASTEIIKYLHVPAVFLCCAYVTLDRGQTAIDLLSQKFPEKMQSVIAVFSHALGTAISAFLGYRGVIQMLKHIEVHAMSNVTGFGFPLWPFSLIFSLGLFMLAFSFLWSIVRVVVPKVDLEPIEEEGGAEV